MYFIFQGELDTLSATLKQLENQKGEAQKRLNDLRNQVTDFCILQKHLGKQLICIVFNIT